MPSVPRSVLTIAARVAPQEPEHRHAGRAATCARGLTRREHSPTRGEATPANGPGPRPRPGPELISARGCAPSQPSAGMRFRRRGPGFRGGDHHAVQVSNDVRSPGPAVARDVGRLVRGAASVPVAAVPAPAAADGDVARWIGAVVTAVIGAVAVVRVGGIRDAAAKRGGQSERRQR